MKIELKFNGQSMLMEGPAEEIRTALKGALENNAEFYAMCKDLVAAMMYEEVHDKVAAEIAGRKSNRILGKHKN